MKSPYIVRCKKSILWGSRFSRGDYIATGEIPTKNPSRAHVYCQYKTDSGFEFEDPNNNWSLRDYFKPIKFKIVPLEQ